jgi:acyl-[acyl carrier protein]--UDP-N-acetylglucosamine O-acyltransferase
MSKPNNVVDFLIGETDMAAEGIGPTPGEYIRHHLGHLSNSKQTEIVDFSVINMNCAIGHDCVIGAFASLAPGVSLGGHTQLGEGVDMGVNSCTIQGIQVGGGSVVGAGAALVRDVAEGCMVVGVPGKVIGLIKRS